MTLPPQRPRRRLTDLQVAGVALLAGLPVMGMVLAVALAGGWPVRDAPEPAPAPEVVQTAPTEPGPPIATPPQRPPAAPEGASEAAPRVAAPEVAVRTRPRPAEPRTPLPPEITAPVVFYASCDDARAAGAAPLPAGAPGYRPALDRDTDGTACDAEDQAPEPEPEPTSATPEPEPEPDPSSGATPSPSPSP